MLDFEKLTNPPMGLDSCGVEWNTWEEWEHSDHSHLPLILFQYAEWHFLEEDLNQKLNGWPKKQFHPQLTWLIHEFMLLIYIISVTYVSLSTPDLGVASWKLYDWGSLQIYRGVHWKVFSLSQLHIADMTSRGRLINPVNFIIFSSLLCVISFLSTGWASVLHPQCSASIQS